jgi:DNA-binding HxlR family transcriptional regulator
MPYQDGVYGCPVEAALHMISGKWKPRIIHELFRGTKRFGELQRLLPGISRHVLTTQLRELETDNIVERTVYPTVPPKVEYRLTDFCLAFIDLIWVLSGCSEPAAGTGYAHDSISVGAGHPQKIRVCF